MKDPHLISVDELRAAGALDVPAEWRKSLGEERKLGNGRNLRLFDDDDGPGEEQSAASLDADSEDSAED